MTDKKLKEIRKKIKKMEIPTIGLEDYKEKDLYYELKKRYYNAFDEDLRDKKEVYKMLREEAEIKGNTILKKNKSEEQGLEEDWTGLPPVKKRRGKALIDNINVEESEFHETSRQALESILTFVDAKVCNTVDEFADALINFFNGMTERGEIPTVEKMALALGYTNHSLGDIRNGSKGYEVAELVNKAYQIIGAYDIEMASQGQMNPTIYIFRSKNFYGLKDDYNVVIPADENRRELDSEENIRKRMMQDLPSVDVDFVDEE